MNMEIMHNIWMVIAVLFLITYSCTIYSFIDLIITKKKLKNSQKYNETLKSLNEDVSCFKHDFSNMITTIGGYVTTEDMDGLKNYYTHLEKDCVELNSLSVLNPELINDPGIYNLINKKYELSEKLGVKMNFEILLDFKKLKINVYKFTRILGILLDNAIEAASGSKEKFVNVCFRSELNKNRQLVIIENSYKNKNIDINEIFEKNKTDKENHSGLGLFKVRKILSKSSNLNLYTTKNEYTFRQQLEIYY